MRREAAASALVSGERIGGGLAADGTGRAVEAPARRASRDGACGSRATRACSSRCCPSSAPAIGFDQESRYHDLTVDEHTFAVVQAAADAGAPLRVRLAALFHDLGKPLVAWRGTDGRLHYYAQAGHRATRARAPSRAELADDALRRLRYPNELRKPRRLDRARAHVRHRPGRRRCAPAGSCARYGDDLAIDLLDHKQADLRGKAADRATSRVQQLERLAGFRAVVDEQRSSPHRLRDLAVDGDDLLALGYEPGPERWASRSVRCSKRSSTTRPSTTRDRLLERAEALRVIRWEQPGYVVAFTTRVGGVSDGDLRVAEPRRAAPATISRRTSRRTGAWRAPSSELDPERLTFNRQVHSADGARGGRRPARGGGRRPLDDRARRAAARLAADCVPIALAATGGIPRLAVLHAGWRGLADGIVEPGVAGLGGGERAGRRRRAGDRARAATRSAPRSPTRFDADLTTGRMLDLRQCRRAAPRGSGRRRGSSASTSARAAIPSSSSPTVATGLARGVQGVIGAVALSRSASGSSGCRADVGPGVTVVAATKYVSLADMALLVEAGIEVVGENRAQDLEAKHADYGDAFRWHFIGHLQSNKVKVVNRHLRARPLARLALGGPAARGARARRR